MLQPLRSTIHILDFVRYTDSKILNEKLQKPPRLASGTVASYYKIGDQSSCLMYSLTVNTGTSTPS